MWVGLCIQKLAKPEKGPEPQTVGGQGCSASCFLPSLPSWTPSTQCARLSSCQHFSSWAFDTHEETSLKQICNTVSQG